MKLYEEEFKIYGPYTRSSDGRKYLSLECKSTGRKTTLSYPKYIMEVHLGHYLEEGETVDHIDRNFRNDDISNLQVLKQVDHSLLDARRLKEKIFVCEYCGTSFSLVGTKLHDARCNRLKGKKGPFCGRSCAGKASSAIWNYENKTIVQDYEYRIK